MASSPPDDPDGRDPAEGPADAPPPVSRRGPAPRPAAAPGSSWFKVGFALGLGGTLAWVTTQTLLQVSNLLTLLLLAMFLAIALDPVVTWLTSHRLPRGWAVAVVLTLVLAALAGFLALVIPPVSNEINALTKAIPGWLKQLHDHQSTLGKLEDRFHLLDKAHQRLSSGGTSDLLGGLLGAGKAVISAVASTAIVIVVAVYMMAFLPALKSFCLRFVRSDRREHVRAMTEEILSRTGRYMLGNVATSVIAGLATFLWCEATGVRYAAALGVFVALMDLVPIVGSTIGGIVVSLIALSVSLPVAVATAGFYIAFRLAEDYVIVPKVMKFAVNVHPLVTVVGVLIGGALLGIIGALVAIPAAVAIGLILDEYVFTKTDAHR
ncbi:AI-2E family transporter [Streptomyces sp. NPDC020719]|uniref:AI-2E family transporter n=1 Tax=unclassified Streptomyces TaxID=2593676 RepID=UPI0033C97CEC